MITMITQILMTIIMRTMTTIALGPPSCSRTQSVRSALCGRLPRKGGRAGGTRGKNNEHYTQTSTNSNNNQYIQITANNTYNYQTVELEDSEIMQASNTKPQLNKSNNNNTPLKYTTQPRKKSRKTQKKTPQGGPFLRWRVCGPGQICLFPATYS